MKKTILSYVFINLLNIWLPRKQLSVSIFFCIQSDSSWIILENMSDALLSYFETFPCITDFLKLTIISPMSSGVFKHREIVMLTMVHTNFPKKNFFFHKSSHFIHASNPVRLSWMDIFKKMSRAQNWVTAAVRCSCQWSWCATENMASSAGNSNGGTRHTAPRVNRHRRTHFKCHASAFGALPVSFHGILRAWGLQVEM